jgi:hypothetical protein
MDPIPILLWCPECTERHIDVRRVRDETAPHARLPALRTCVAPGHCRNVRGQVPPWVQERTRNHRQPQAHRPAGPRTRANAAHDGTVLGYVRLAN